MKAKFLCFKISKTVSMLVIIILVQLIFIIIGIKEIKESISFEQMKEDVKKYDNTLKEERNIVIYKNENLKEEADKGEIKGNQNIIKNEIEKQVKNESLKKEYETMPSNIKGYKVIGKIQIPKLNLDTCILEETNKKSLKASVTKLYGPSINKPGNFCIAGHNYRNNKMFGGIKKLEKGDEIILIDTFGDSIKYEVYENYQTDPKDVTALNQETDGEREITLITCTAGAIKRVIVKAVEVYD